MITNVISEQKIEYAFVVEARLNALLSSPFPSKYGNSLAKPVVIPKLPKRAYVFIIKRACQMPISSGPTHLNTKNPEIIFTKMVNSDEPVK